MKRKDRGFTMVELLLALMLTGFLTAALSMMIGQAARDRAKLAETVQTPVWAVQVLDLMEYDLRQARQWAGSQDRLVLLGMNRDGLPALIEYRWSQREDTRLWTRQQTPLAQPAAANQTPPEPPELLAVQIDGVQVGPHQYGQADSISSFAQPQPASTSTPTVLINGKPTALSLLPDQLTLEITWPGQTLQRKVVLR